MRSENSELFFNNIRDSLIGKTNLVLSTKGGTESGVNQSKNGQSRWAFLIEAMKQDKAKREEL